MARIRTIKPEFFKHGDLYDLEKETGLPMRVAFAGIWTCCDRDGRFSWKSRELKTDVLPHDDVDFSKVLDGLQAAGFVQKYTVNGKVYGYVPSWSEHQVINNRESISRLPAPDDASITRAARVDHAPVGEGKGKEGNRKGNKQTPSVAIAPVDERKAPIREAIKKGYAWRNENRECPWGVAEETILKRVLSEVPKSYTAEFFVQCIRNKFKSDEAHSPPPREWLKFILTYADGPIDRFRKPKSLGESNGRKAQISQDQQRDDFRQMAAAIDGESDCETAVPKQHLLPDSSAKERGHGGLVEIGKSAGAGKVY